MLGAVARPLINCGLKSDLVVVLSMIVVLKEEEKTLVIMGTTQGGL